MARIVNASNFIDERGSLSVVEDDMLGFTPKRVFNLYNLNVNADRGNHGHKRGKRQRTVRWSGSVFAEPVGGASLSYRAAVLLTCASALT